MGIITSQDKRNDDRGILFEHAQNSCPTSSIQSRGTAFADERIGSVRQISLVGCPKKFCNSFWTRAAKWCMNTPQKVSNS